MTASRNAFDLTGRTAAVVGGGSGIGEAVTIGCARHGANVVCLDVNMAAAMGVAQRVVEHGGVCEAEVRRRRMAGGGWKVHATWDMNVKRVRGSGFRVRRSGFRVL